MIPLFTVNMPESVDKPLLETLHSGYITQGPKVEEFERLLRYYFKVNALTVNSGTSALTIALRLAGVGPGDKVITTPMTCSATNLPILSLGAEPVFADIDPDTGLISAKSVRNLLESGIKAKAVMGVEWGGSPVATDELCAIAHAHGAKLIIDSAHSFGAPHTIDSKADFICFSLQAIKHITTVDGGVVLIRNDEAYARGKRLRWFGIARDTDSLDSRISEDIEEWGYKFHMNDVAATIGIEQMKRLKIILSMHLLIARNYNEQVSDFYGKPPMDQGVYWLYTLRLPTPALRDKFREYMTSRGITVSQVHRRNDEYSVFKPYAKEHLPGVTKFNDTMVCIPIHTALTAGNIMQIINSCNKFAEANKL